MRGFHSLRIGMLLCLVSLFAHAEPNNAPLADQTSPPVAERQPTCLLVEAAARDAGLPVEFFTRLIWRESRFRPDAVGPMTRFNARAQGIGQFMPATAAER